MDSLHWSLRVCQTASIVADMETDSPAGRVAANVKSLRARRGLTVRDLSRRLGEIGSPMLPSTVSKLENGGRQVDADDLVALALVLGVSPNRLLLPGVIRDDAVTLAPKVVTSESAAWWWATGEERIPGPFSPPGDQFVAENRPHDPPDTVTLPELVKLESSGELDDLREAYTKARASGLGHKTISNYLELQESRRSREELLQAEKELFGPGIDVGRSDS
jgi:transcriptional regulator with XRE-family HTH domain